MKQKLEFHHYTVNIYNKLYIYWFNRLKYICIHINKQLKELYILSNKLHHINN